MMGDKQYDVCMGVKHVLLYMLSKCYITESHMHRLPTLLYL